MDQEQVVEQITAFVTQWGLKVVGALAVLIVGRMVAGMIRRAVRRAYRATDACGNSATCVQRFYLIDDIPPVIACPDEMWWSAALSHPWPGHLSPAA